jgi:Spy/CpxP family protein refolding chaperone
MKKLTVIALFVSGILLLAANASASPQMDRSRNRFDVGSNPGRLLAFVKANQEELEVTDEQLAKIEEMTFKMEEMTVKQRNEMANIQLELKRQIRDREKRDYEKIKSLLTQSAELRTDLIVNRMKLRDEIRNILTSEQLTELKEIARNKLVQKRFVMRRDVMRKNFRQERPLFRR